MINLLMNNQKEELQGVIDMYKTSSPDSEHEKDMLQSILTLNDTTVEEVFTHRKNIYSIDSSLEINEIIKKLIILDLQEFLFGKIILKIL